MLALSSQPQPLAIAAHAQLARTSVSALSLTLASSAFAASTSAASAPTASSDVTCSHDQLLALLEESSPDGYGSNHRAAYEPSQRPGVGRSGTAAAGGEVLLVDRDSGGVQALLRLQSAERVPRRHHPAPARHRRSGPAGLNSQ